MDIETLNAKHFIAGYLTFKEGPSGFPAALITTPPLYCRYHPIRCSSAIVYFRLGYA